MADKSFEEQVRDEMAGLSLKPGAEVWEQVEIAIKKEKRRRWFIWLFLLIGGCASGSFLFYHEFVQTNNNNSHESGLENSKQNSPVVKPEIQADKSINLDVTQLPLHQNKAANIVVKNKSEDILFNKSISQKNNTSESKPAPTVSVADESMYLTLSESEHKREKTSVENVNQKVYTNNTIIKDSTDVLTKIAEPFLPSNIQQKSKATDFVKTDTSINNNSLSENEISKSALLKPKHPWQFAASFDIGKSGISELSGQNTGSLFSNAMSPSIGSGSAFSSSFKIPSLTTGFSWGINLEANKKINQIFGYQISLGYQFYQSKIGAGNRVDSIMIISGTNRNIDDGFYYLSTDERKYTNQYHFLQTGFSFYADQQVAKTVSVRWHIGTAVNLLVNSNVLQYDAAKGILYRSRYLLNDFQINVRTGFDIGFGKKPIFYAGPTLTYFITHPSQMQGSNNQHLFRVGARVVYILPKKKK